MTDQLPLTNADGEVRELTEEDFKNAVPFSALPESLQATLLGLKEQRKEPLPSKISTTIGFDREIVEAFRATGKGWQERMNQALREWLHEHAL
jgi:uncharacterized protein (DUF4415 family)